jgi:hypothetical protein
VIWQGEVAKELRRLVRLGMLVELRPDDGRRVCYDRTDSPPGRSLVSGPGQHERLRIFREATEVRPGLREPVLAGVSRRSGLSEPTLRFPRGVDDREGGDPHSKQAAADVIEPDRAAAR